MVSEGELLIHLTFFLKKIKRDMQLTTKLTKQFSAANEVANAIYSVAYVTEKEILQCGF